MNYKMKIKKTFSDWYEGLWTARAVLLGLCVVVAGMLHDAFVSEPPAVLRCAVVANFLVFAVAAVELCVWLRSRMTTILGKSFVDVSVVILVMLALILSLECLGSRTTFAAIDTPTAAFAAAVEGDLVIAFYASAHLLSFGLIWCLCVAARKLFFDAGE